MRGLCERKMVSDTWRGLAKRWQTPRRGLATRWQTPCSVGGREVRAQAAALELLRGQPLDGRRVPGAGHAVRRAADALQRLLEDAREDQERRADARAAEQPADGRQHLARLGRDDGLLAIVAVAKPDAAGDADLRDGAGHLQIVRVRIAVDDREVAGERIEDEALVEHVAEVEREPPRQRGD